MTVIHEEIAQLRERAAHCETMAAERHRDRVAWARLRGKANGYRHAAELIEAVAGEQALAIRDVPDLAPATGTSLPSDDGMSFALLVNILAGCYTGPAEQERVGTGAQWTSSHPDRARLDLHDCLGFRIDLVRQDPCDDDGQILMRTPGRGADHDGVLMGHDMDAAKARAEEIVSEWIDSSLRILGRLPAGNAAPSGADMDGGTP